MSRFLALITLLSLLAVATTATAQSPTGGTEAAEPVATTGGTPVTVSDGRITVSVKSDAVLGRTVRFRGRVPSDHAGRTILIERYDLKKDAWVREAAAVVAGDGAFLARWKTDSAGHLRLRARVEIPQTTARASDASPELNLTVYKPAKATWYGPGFYGRTTACGLKMSRTLVGVAHRTLPCGTKVAVMYENRVLTVPVVDRGPYANGAKWDITYAAAQALGFLHTDVVGTVRVPAEPAPAR